MVVFALYIIDEWVPIYFGLILSIITIIRMTTIIFLRLNYE